MLGAISISTHLFIYLSSYMSIIFHLTLQPVFLYLSIYPSIYLFSLHMISLMITFPPRSRWRPSFTPWMVLSQVSYIVTAVRVSGHFITFESKMVSPEHGFDLDSRSQTAVCLIAALSATFIIVRPAGNRDRPSRQGFV